MKPGTYIFKVKAKNDEGIWSNSVASLNITINAPFWQSWWFVLLEIILVI